jgi:MFS family permease
MCVLCSKRQSGVKYGGGIPAFAGMTGESSWIGAMRRKTVFPQGYWTVWTATLLFFVAYYTLLVPVPLYLTEIGLPDWQVGVILGAFGVASLLFRPLAGALCDLWDRRRVMWIGAVALIVGAAGFSLTALAIPLFILRVLQSVGYVAFTTAGTALVSDLAKPEQRAGTLANFGIAANLAMTLTPATISALLAVLTLPGAMRLSALLAGVGGVLAVRVPGIRSLKAGQTDWRASLRIPSVLYMPMLAAWMLGVGFGAYLQFLPLLTERRGIAGGGLVYTVYGLSIILTRLTTGRLLDGANRALALRISFLIMAAGLLFFTFAYSLIPLLVGAACVAIGGGISHPALIATHVDVLGPGERGRAVSFFYLGFDLGIGLGAWLLAPFLQIFGLTGLYGAAAVIALVGAGLARRAVPRPQLAAGTV